MGKNNQPGKPGKKTVKAAPAGRAKKATTPRPAAAPPSNLATKALKDFADARAAGQAHLEVTAQAAETVRAAAGEPDLFFEEGFDAKKETINPREKRFIELFFFSGEGLSRVEAAKRAGFSAKSTAGLMLAAKRAIVKLESQVDHREIFRKVGLGEMEVAKGILAMVNDKTIPPSVRLNAWIAASKILGIQRDVMDIGTGAKIVINPTRTVEGPDPVTGEAGTGGSSAQPGQPALRAPQKGPIAIVR